MSYTWFKIRILIQWPVGPLDLKIKWPTAISRCPSIAKFMFTMGYGGSFPGKRLSKWYKSRHIWHIVAMTTGPPLSFNAGHTPRVIARSQKWTGFGFGPMWPLFWVQIKPFGGYESPLIYYLQYKFILVWRSFTKTVPYTCIDFAIVLMMRLCW